MIKTLVVGGTFNNDGGKESGLIKSIYENIKEDNEFDITYHNGGHTADLPDILASVIYYDVVMWFPNVPNEEKKYRTVKEINPKAILINSKRNDDNKYSFAELISRSLTLKANLTIEFSKVADFFNMTLFDPLGNIYYEGIKVEGLCKALASRTKKLLTFTRKPSIRDERVAGFTIPSQPEFFDFAHNCADIFHNLIKPARGTERFLGNMSFRCQNGFPSFRGQDGIIYVSKRNVNKADIDESSFVPTYLDENRDVRYFGENKPSVDTPVQLRLYDYFPWVNYMIHAHCYVDVSGIEDAVQLRTDSPVPCGAIEEVYEVLNAYVMSYQKWAYMKNRPRLFAVNLVGHGCILMTSDVEILKELEKHKDSCFVERPTPEVFSV